MSWNVHKNMRREVAQSLQEARKHARSIENVIQAMTPLVDGEELMAMEVLSENLEFVLDNLNELYKSIAPAAFGQDETV